MRPFRRGSFVYNIISKLQYYFVVYVLIPGIFIFEITIIYPNLVVMLEAGTARQLFHMCIITFWMVNVIGNMTYSMVMDSVLRKPVFGEGTYCQYCRMARPAKTWHCSRCNACIVKRDHHCTFFARCIGLNNKRYFILYLAHSFFAMLYATYYNYHFIMQRFEDEAVILSAVRIINPMLRFIIPEPMGIRDMYVSYLCLNLAILFWSGCLLCYHLRNVVMGVTAYEAKFPSLMDSTKWRQNLVGVFGTRWYLAIVWPLADSPLPDDEKTP